MNFRQLRQGIHNLIRWFPLIWRDRDWDWIYLAAIMLQKLIWMAELEEKHGHHTTSLRDARHQRLCAALLKRLIADEYDENAAKGLRPMGFRRASLEDSRLWFVVKDPDREARLRAYKHADRMRRQDSRYLGLLLGKYLTHWWD